MRVFFLSRVLPKEGDVIALTFFPIDPHFFRLYDNFVTIGGYFCDLFDG